MISFPCVTDGGQNNISVLDYDKRTPLEIPTAFGGEAGSGDERSSFISEKLIEYGNSTHYTNTCILTFFFSCSKNTRELVVTNGICSYTQVIS